MIVVAEPGADPSGALIGDRRTVQPEERVTGGIA
jgi:hypothetical protein